jgi:hypothetical protein
MQQAQIIEFPARPLRPETSEGGRHEVDSRTSHETSLIAGAPTWASPAFSTPWTVRREFRA